MKCSSCKSREALLGKRTCRICLDKAEQRKKIRLARLREQGLCIRCGLQSAEPGHASCARCLAEDAEKNLSKYRLRREAGICVKCGKEPAPSGPMCESCSSRRRAWEFARGERKKTLGLCLKCDRPVVPSKLFCAEHLGLAREYSSARRKTLLSNGLCIGCGKTSPLPGRTLCAPCIDWRTKYRHARNFGDPQTRMLVLQRDDFTCQICLESFEDFRLVVHHIDGSGADENPNHDLTNLTTLCHHCHVIVHNTARFVKNRDLFSSLVASLRQEEL